MSSLSFLLSFCPSLFLSMYPWWNSILSQWMTVYWKLGNIKHRTFEDIGEEEKWDLWVRKGAGTVCLTVGRTLKGFIKYISDSLLADSFNYQLRFPPYLGDNFLVGNIGKCAYIEKLPWINLRDFSLYFHWKKWEYWNLVNKYLLLMPCGLCWSYHLFFKLTVKLDLKAFSERIHHFLWLSPSCYFITFSAVQVFLVLFIVFLKVFMSPN